MERLDQMIAETRAERVGFWQRSAACAGDYDRRGFLIDAAALAIRETALLDARAAVVGRREPGFERAISRAS